MWLHIYNNHWTFKLIEILLLRQGYRRSLFELLWFSVQQHLPCCAEGSVLLGGQSEIHERLRWLAHRSRHCWTVDEFSCVLSTNRHSGMIWYSEEFTWKRNYSFYTMNLFGEIWLTERSSKIIGNCDMECINEFKWLNEKKYYLGDSAFRMYNGIITNVRQRALGNSRRRCENQGNPPWSDRPLYPIYQVSFFLIK